MKKIILILASLLFVSCTRTVYVDRETNEVVQELNKEDFIKLEKVVNNIYVDKYTDVLYYKFTNTYAHNLTPIMKADGTCLTYTAWKERNK